MNYQDAKEVARKNPGAVVVRGQDGGFVVRLVDGLVVSVSLDSSNDVRAEGDIEALSQRCKYLSWRIEESEKIYKKKVSELDILIDELNAVLRNVRDEKRGLEIELNDIRSRLGKVSQQEWERIRVEDENNRLNYVEEMRSQRNTKECSCKGEVENCVRCGGSGYYTTDGYGNFV